MFNLIKPVYAQPTNLSQEYGFGGLTGIKELIGAFVDPVFNIVALLILFYFLYAGWKYLTSQGNKDELAKARAMIIHALIGAFMLAILFLIMQTLFRLYGITNVPDVTNPKF